MADEDHRDAVRREAVHDLEQRVGLGLGQGRGRLVHEDEPGVGDQRPADRDHLALGDRELAERPVEIEGEVEPVERGARRPRIARWLTSRGRPPRFSLEGDVLGHGQMREQRQVLPDDLHAELRAGPA